MDFRDFRDLVFKSRPNVRELSGIMELLYILIEILVTWVDVFIRT